MRPSRIGVLCVDDHRLVREGLELIIDRQPDMKVVASAATAEEATRFFRIYHPDVTLMDLQLGSVSGVDAIRTIRREHADARIVVLTMSQADEDIHQALEAGAVTYLVKDMVSGDLIRIIREVNAGKQPDVSPELRARLDKRAGRPKVTPREIQVIQLIARGMRNKEIAAVLGISEETAQVHVKNILGKLNVQDRTAAVSVALQRGIIHLP